MAKLWYTVEIIYKSENETKMFRITNLDGSSLKQFRESVFIGGAYRKIDDDTGEVISPWNIKQFMIYKQEHFFNADVPTKLVHSSLKK